MFIFRWLIENNLWIMSIIFLWNDIYKYINNFSLFSIFACFLWPYLRVLVTYHSSTNLKTGLIKLTFHLKVNLIWKLTFSFCLESFFHRIRTMIITVHWLIMYNCFLCCHITYIKLHFSFIDSHGFIKFSLRYNAFVSNYWEPTCSGLYSTAEKHFFIFNNSE